MAALVFFLSKLTDGIFMSGTVAYILHAALCRVAGLLVYLVMAYLLDIKSFKTALGGVFGGRK